MSSIDTLQQPRHDRGPPLESHDEFADLHIREIQTLPIGGQQAPLDAADLACPGPPLSPPDSPIHPSIDSPGWKRLISTSLAAHERTAMIATLFMNRDEVEAMKHIGGDDAQTFVDTIHEVRFHPLIPPKSDPTDSVSSLPIRRWIVLTTCYGRGACDFCVRSVATKL